MGGLFLVQAKTNRSQVFKLEHLAPAKHFA